MSANLILHAGAKLVDRDALAAIPLPPATATWCPVGHLDVLEAVEATLQATGFEVARQQLGLNPSGTRFFATLDLTSPLADGVSLAVGVRNSIDKTFPLGFCAGSRVFVCDNLSFSAELTVRTKHTRFGAERFREAISLATGRLDVFRQAERGRIDFMQATELDDREAESLVLRAWEAKVINHTHLPAVLQEWRRPSHEEFSPRNRWSLFNAVTEVLRPVGERNPTSLVVRTFGLNALLCPPQEGPADIQTVLADTQSEIDALIAADVED